MASVGSGKSAVALGAALVVAWCGAAGGCSTNHDALARQPEGGESGGGKAGSLGTSGFGNTGDVSSQGGRVNPNDEPAGDDVLTIVNGVVDAPSVALCFARLDADGQTESFVGEPMTELAYAGSVALTEIAGLSWAEDTIQPWVLAGDLALLEGSSCEEAVALADAEEAKVTPEAGPEEAAGGQSSGTGGAGGGSGAGGEGGAEPLPPLEMPTLRARPLAAIPAGSLNIGRSILMVMSGCLGGAAYRDAVATAICGPDYEPGSPSLQPVVLTLSRHLDIDKVGLQAVQASLAVGSIDVRASGGDAAIALVFASTVGFGTIEPRPADTRFSPGELGVAAANYGLQAIDENGGVLFQESWPDIMHSSGLEQIEGARTYSAILVGPSPLLIKQGWWQPSAFVLVDNDPTRH